MLRALEQWQRVSTRAMQRQELIPAQEELQRRPTKGAVGEHLKATGSTK